MGQKLDKVCEMCDGYGMVFNKPCFCGRPMVYEFGTFASCVKDVCKKNAKRADDERIEKERAANPAKAVKAKHNPKV